ncbi:MAG: hypothetical protein IJI57_07180 [Flexilinea sp.]|nr:hypothetical protein [Flexilinea sp.]
MKITYRTRDLERVCNDKRLAIKKYGTLSAKWLEVCLLSLKGSSLDELLHIGFRHIHLLEREYAGCYAMRLDGGLRLVFSVSNHGEIEIVCIEDIIDYH